MNQSVITIIAGISSGIASALTIFLLPKVENYLRKDTKKKNNSKESKVGIFILIIVPIANIIFITIFLDFSKFYTLMVMLNAIIFIYAFMRFSYLKPLLNSTDKLIEHQKQILEIIENSK